MILLFLPLRLRVYLFSLAQSPRQVTREEYFSSPVSACAPFPKAGKCSATKKTGAEIDLGLFRSEFAPRNRVRAVPVRGAVLRRHEMNVLYSLVSSLSPSLRYNSINARRISTRKVCERLDDRLHGVIRGSKALCDNKRVWA